MTSALQRSIGTRLRRLPLEPLGAALGLVAYEGELVLGPSIDGDDIPALRRTLDGARIRHSETLRQKVRFTGILDLTGQKGVNPALAGLLLPGPGKVPR